MSGLMQQTLTCVPLVFQLHPELLMQIPVCPPLVTFADHDGKGRRQSFEDGLQDVSHGEYGTLRGGPVAP